MKYLIFLISLITVFTTQAQSSIAIAPQPVKISADIPDTTIYLARYFGNKLFYADTTESKNGSFQFEGNKHRGGLYAIILPNGKPFDIILDNEEIDIHINNVEEPIPTLEVKKSINNKLFFDYMNYMAQKRIESKPIGTKMNLPETTDKQKEKYKAQLSQINDDVVKMQQDIIINHADKFVGIMLGMTIDKKLPEHPRDEEGNITDSNFVYNYYMQHYWDNVNLKDYRTVNTPVFHNKLDKFFGKSGVMLLPDSVFYYTQDLINKTDIMDQNNKVFQYIVHHVTNKYETSQIMGMDKVFYLMAKNYYCFPNNVAYWMTPENTKKVCERADKIAPTIVGGPSFPIILPDSTEKNWISTYDIEAEYTVLYFWDPECGHCKKITPKLDTLYDKKFKERNVEVYAIGKATGADFDKWKAFIVKYDLSFINVGITPTVYKAATDSTDNQKGLSILLREHTTLQSLNYADTWDVYSTPRIFILDKDKKIVYKQVSIGQLELIIDKLTGHEEDEKLFPLDDPENGDNPPSE
ncbi:MAG: DUF4369 domain-containing protein [Crocinitomix sp.]|nr:DUF4369 domain-containing protein [Crocinitomix sp.]